MQAFLDARRDPNVPLRILGYTKVYIDVAATIDVDDNYPRRATLAAAQAALNPGLNPDNTAGYFAFERLEFGQSIYLSTVYAELQRVSGVRDATITTLRRLDPLVSTRPNQSLFVDATITTLHRLDRPSTEPGDIPIQPTELVVIDPTENSSSKLTITLGKGGYIDT